MLDVSCPSCGAKLKADEKMAGKKAKCKKCGTGFRIPGDKVGESLAEGQTLGTPAPPLPGDDAGVAMAMAVDDDVPMAAPLAPPPPPAAKPAEVAALPSADPFDFSKPAAPAAKPAAPPAAQPAPPTAAPAKAAFGAAKSAPPAPVPPKPAAPPPPAPAAKVAPPAAKPAPPAAEPEPVPEAAEVVDEDDNPFSFGGGGAAAAKKNGAKDDAPKKEKDADAKPKAEDPEPKPKKKAAPKPKADDDDDAPAVDPNNPFTLGALLDGPPAPPEPKKKKRGEEDDDEPKAKKKPKKDGEEGDADEDKPGYRRPEERGGKGMAVLITLVVGGLALALGGAAVVRYMKDKRADAVAEAKRKAEEEAKKKNEDPFANTPPGPGGPGPEPKGKDPEPKPKGKDDTKGKVEPKPKDVNPASGKPMIGVPKLKAVTVAPVGDKLTNSDKPKDGLVLDSALGAVRRVFPRAKKTDELFVLVQTNPGAGGAGEQLALDVYTASNARDAAARIEFPGDSVAQPIADLIPTPDGGALFVAGILGKVHVWNVREKRKLADGLDPYADKPAHRAAGLAAVFFAPGGKQVVTVSTAGAVLLVDLASGKAVSEFVPEHGTAGRVLLGTSVAKAEGNGSVAVAVAGVVYQVKVAPGLEVVRKLDLGGDVGRSMGVAVSGTPGRILYTFETNDGGKKDKVVAMLALDDKGKGPQFFAFPTGAAGTDGKGAVFAGGELGGALTDKGAVWFDDDEGKIVPLMATVPTASAQFYGSGDNIWYAIPDPKMPAKTVLAAISAELNDREDLKKNFGANKPLTALRVDAEGASH
jgi:hypothetical protein